MISTSLYISSIKISYTTGRGDLKHELKLYCNLNCHPTGSYLQKGGDFVHELEDVSHVDKGYVEHRPGQHEEDGVEVLYLGVIHDGGDHQVETDQHHHHGDHNGTLRLGF